MGSVAATDDVRTTRGRQLPLVLGVAAAVLVLDQLTKWWAVNELADRTIDLVWTLRLHLVFNDGMAFSLANGLGPYIAVLALLVVGALLWTGRTLSTRAGAVALGMILGGALGNLVDRAFRAGDGFLGGHVVDWIDVQWWPIFNVADAAVVIGALLLVVVSYRGEA